MRVPSFLRNGLFHLVLVLLSVLFSLPFLWMISTSFKADDEIIHDPMIWIPELPMRVRQSPYLDFEAHPPRWNRPVLLPPEVNWNDLQREIRVSLSRRAFEIFTSPDWPAPLSPNEKQLFIKARRDIEDSLWTALRKRISGPVWKEKGIPERIAGVVEMEDVVRAWNKVYRSVGIGEIKIRNASGARIGYSPKPADDRIPYRLAGTEPVLLTERTVELASPEETINEIMARIRGDLSYHRLVMELETPEQVFRSENPRFLSSGEYQDFFFKFRSQARYEVQHTRLVPDPTRRPEISPGRIRLRFYLIPSSYAAVLWQRLTENYREVFYWIPFGTYTWVTVKLTVLNIIGQLLACSMVGFAFAKLKFPGRDLLFILMLSTMMLPPQVTMIPQFVLFSKMGAYNTLFPLYIFSFTGAPFFIFLIRQFYRTIPNDLNDAAKIDGCGYFATYWRVMLPLVKPALAAIAIFQFQATWNEFLQPLIYITDTSKTPMSVGLFLFRQSHAAAYWAELMAASSLMTIPIIVLFFFTQRYFIQGITLTGLKG